MVLANAMLTLDGVTVSGSVITDNASIELDNTVKLKDGATIQGASAASRGADRGAILVVRFILTANPECGLSGPNPLDQQAAGVLPAHVLINVACPFKG